LEFGICVNINIQKVTNNALALLTNFKPSEFKEIVWVAFSVLTNVSGSFHKHLDRFTYINLDFYAFKYK
jgi:hypothetical protein